MQFIRTAAITITAAAALSAAGLSLAKTSAEHAEAAAHAQQRQAQFEARHAQHMEQLKTLLQIQNSQQSAWEQYAAAMKPDFAHFAKEKPTDKTAPKSHPNTLQMLDMRQKHRELEQKRDDATRAFYSSLNPAQQKAFDQIAHKHDRKHGRHDFKHDHKGLKNEKHRD